MSHSDRQVSVWCLAAWGLWAAVAALLLAGTIVGLVGGLDRIAVAAALFAHALAGSAAAATLSIRNIIVRRDKMLHDAFMMGMEAGGLRPINGGRPSLDRQG